MATATVDKADIVIETDRVRARVRTEGYTTGVAGETFLDKRTGARDLGFGLDIVDFLAEPGEDDPSYEPHRYAFRDALHGDIPKRYVELPQICTAAGKLDYKVTEGEGFVAVTQWYRWTIATAGRRPGSLWEQRLVFPDGRRYFYACDTVTCANAHENVFMRLDMPGHIKHRKADTFSRVYLSYRGVVDPSRFAEDFPPDGMGGELLYSRPASPAPERMIRAYQVRLEGREGPWLAGMTLDPGDVWEAWCHQRGYVCMIQEIGGVEVGAGDRFGACYVVGWFDSIEEMERVYDEHAGARRIELGGGGYDLAR